MFTVTHNNLLFCSQIETFSFSLLKCNYKVSLAIWFLFMAHLFYFIFYLFIFFFLYKALNRIAWNRPSVSQKEKTNRVKKRKNETRGDKDKEWEKETERRKVYSHVWFELSFNLLGMLWGAAEWGRLLKTHRTPSRGWGCSDGGQIGWGLGTEPLLRCWW